MTINPQFLEFSRGSLFANLSELLKRALGVRNLAATGNVANRDAGVFSMPLVDLSQTVGAAAAAFPEWSASDPAFRREIFARASELLAEREAEFVAMAAQEVGATADWVRFNIKLAQGYFQHAIDLTKRLEEPELVQTNGSISSVVLRQPCGVVLGIAPWNAPVTLAVRAIAAPLACGNTVLLKASELCPRVHEMIVDVLLDAGLPKGVACAVTHAPDEGEQVVEALINHGAVRRINFTGSTRVGRRIAELAARQLKPCLLELSGKAPLIVLEDADLAEAAKAAAFGAFFNQGQICMSTERVIVQDTIADEFVGMLAKHAEALEAGHPMSSDLPIGALINASAANRVRGLIDDAVARGAKLVTGGDVAGAIVQPAILDHVSSGMKIYAEESFGPVATILRAEDADEAVSIANDTEFGLAASIYSANLDKARDVANRIEAGICHINGPTVYDDPNMPFGGVKASGYGRFGGDSSIHEFTDLKWITTTNGPRQYALWPQ